MEQSPLVLERGPWEEKNRRKDEREETEQREKKADRLDIKRNRLKFAQRCHFGPLS